jgi:uncharacterized protein (TIRG00374 family)
VPADSHARGYRRSLSFALRIALAVGIIWWLVYQAGWQEVVTTLSHADPLFLLLAIVAVGFESMAKAWNWGRLLDHLGRNSTRRLGHLLHAYLVGTLVGSVLPSTASTDAMRAVIAQRHFGGRPTVYAASIIICNLLNWIAACSLALLCVAVLAASDELPSYEYWSVPLFIGVVVAGIGLHVALKYYRKLWLLALRKIMRRRWWGLRRAIRRLANALLVFERRHVRFAPRAFVSTLAALFCGLTFAATARAVGVDLPLAAWGVIVPLITLSGLLPISISGLGGAQAVLVVLLAPFGVGVAQAFATSALYALVNIMFTVVSGAIAWLFGPEVLKRAPDGQLRVSGSAEETS